MSINVPSSVTGPHLVGVDLYHGDGPIQYHALAAAGVCFTIAKSSQGLHMQDLQYAANRKAAAVMAQETWFRYGAYHFFDPDTDPVEQIENFWRAAAPVAGDLIPSLDVETLAQQSHMDSLDDRACTAAMCLKRICGYYPIGYASESFLLSYLPQFAALCGHHWVARYGPQPQIPMAIWQYTDSGQIDGVDHVLDMDVFFGDQEAFQGLCLT